MHFVNCSPKAYSKQEAPEGSHTAISTIVSVHQSYEEHKLWYLISDYDRTINLNDYLQL